MTRPRVSLGRTDTVVTADDVMLTSDSEARIGGQRSRCRMSGSHGPP